MTILYFDCFSGISGDMFLGALIDAGLDINALRQELAKLKLDNYEISAHPVEKQNIASTQFKVVYQEEQQHRHLRHLNEIVDFSDLDEDIKNRAKEVFLKIARAEAKIHNMPVEKVHFHEVGAIDTIVDVVGAFAAIKLLGIDKVYSSRLNVGSGFVTFSHGTFPVPAPATAEILKGVPTYSSDSRGELVTPTGAALITTCAERFGDMPGMRTERIGYGAGSKDIENRPNVLRVFLGQSMEEEGSETVYVVETNIDDMNPQWYEHVMQRLLHDGALDVFLTNTLMKKNRPGILLTMLCREHDLDSLVHILLRETTSIGVRIRKESRRVLTRSIKKVETPYGVVRIKYSKLNGELVNAMPEYDDMTKIADSADISLKKLYAVVQQIINRMGAEK